MFLLDTNICIMAVKRHPLVLAQFQRHSPSDLRVSSVTRAEIAYGIEKSQRKAQNEKVWALFLEPILTMPFDEDAAGEYAQIRVSLESMGRMIGDHDCMIAATALAQGMTVVTHNTAEFSRIDSLAVTDWAI